MDDLIANFLAFTSTEDENTAKQYLEMTGNDLEYAVTLYMESVPPPAAETHTSNHEDDEQIAQRLQNEAYSEQTEVRAADTNIHRHETLVDSFPPQFGGGGLGQMHGSFNNAAAMFGAGRVGIFNQRFDDEENEYHQHRFEEQDDDDYNDDLDEEDDIEDDDFVEIQDLDNDNDQDEDIMIVGSNNEDEGHSRRPVGRRRVNRDSRMSDLSFTQQRLANLFRPPFDIMSKISLDTAKSEGRVSKKWILINIQDAREFQCQVLNRDFWSLTRIKLKVKDNFIFLQYQHDLANGLNYTNFYSTGQLPHIAILDPMTGERVRTWEDGVVPQVESWCSDVDEFLTEFSLAPGSQNPVVKHEVKFDPDALTEEQQIEFAMKQSILDKQEQGTANDPIDLDPSSEPESAPEVPEHVEETDPFKLILAAEHNEPEGPPAATTRVQIRFPNGKRVIHKFDIENDTVLHLYQWLKYLLESSPGNEYGLAAGDHFSLSTPLNKSGKPLIELLDSSIVEAGLKNASVLLEKE